MADAADGLTCRHCAAPLHTQFADLGATPISNEYIYPEQRNGPEAYYPLKAYVCGTCRLVQLQDFFKSSDLFRQNYAYFSSISTSWLEHCRAYADAMTSRFGLDASSHVVELASNDGYLLQYFKAKGIPVLGIEPSASVAEAAIKEKGIPTEVRFFGGRRQRISPHVARPPISSPPTTFWLTFPISTISLAASQSCSSPTVSQPLSSRTCST